MASRGVPDRWLCDVMLARLARLLRAAGHDAALAGSEHPDRQLILQAEEEGRLLLTRDRQLAASVGAGAFLVTPDRPDDQARLLGESFGVNWLAAPFTRCLMDNTMLRPARAEEFAALPPDLPGPVNTCPACSRLYWPGSHVRRMQRRLEILAGQDSR